MSEKRAGCCSSTTTRTFATPSRSLLQLRGFTVETAPDGQAGLERIRTGPPPALVILDFMMPRMNGEEFRAAQLTDATLANVPVIVLSGAGRLTEKATLAGTEVVSKPIDLQLLFGLVARFCERAS